MVLTAAVAVKLAGPVLAAASELLQMVLIAAAVIVGADAAGLVGLLTWRWRRTLKGAGRAMPPLLTKMARPASPLPQKQRTPALPAARQHEPLGGLHLHFHGVSAEDIAAIIRQHDGQTAIGED